MNISPPISHAPNQLSFCAICQEEDAHINLQTICPQTPDGGGHAFHLDCARQAFAYMRIAKCPTCRVDLSNISEAQNALDQLGSKISSSHNTTAAVAQIRQNVAQARQSMMQAQQNYRAAQENLAGEPDSLPLLNAARYAAEELVYRSDHLEDLNQYLRMLQNNEESIA